MRIPGTINFPNATKLKEGRVTMASNLLQPMTDRTATLDEMLKDFPMAAGSTGNSGDRSPKSGTQFDQEVAALMKQIDINVMAASDGKSPICRRNFGRSSKTR